MNKVFRRVGILLNYMNSVCTDFYDFINISNAIADEQL